MKSKAPKTITVVLAFLFFLVGLLGIYSRVLTIGHSIADLCLVISSLLLFLGILVKGI